MTSRGDPVDAFTECARSYCELIDSVDEIGRGELVWSVGEALARLYAAGHALPDESSEGELVDHEESESEAEDLRDRERRSSGKLGEVDYYSGVYDPYDVEGLDPDDVARYVPAQILDQHRDVFQRARTTPDGVPEPVGKLLSDDLMSVYHEVSTGLALFERGERESAIWEWRFGFQGHWGINAASALFALHRLTHVSDARYVARGDE